MLAVSELSVIHVSLRRSLSGRLRHCAPMANARFRCKTPIDAGGTFGGDCEDHVSLAALDRTPESRLWMVLVAFFAWIPLSLALSAVARLVAPAATTVVSIATSMGGVRLRVAFLVALV